MTAQDIISMIRADAPAADLATVKAALEDGAALAALGITDADQEAVEDAHRQIVLALAIAG